MTGPFWPPGAPPWWFAPFIKPLDLAISFNYAVVVYNILRTLTSRMRHEFSLQARVIITLCLLEMVGAWIQYDNFTFIYLAHEVDPTVSMATWWVRLAYASLSVTATGGLIVFFLRGSWSWPLCAIVFCLAEAGAMAAVWYADAVGWL